MGRMYLAILIMLLSTLVYSISYVLQHKGTTESVDSEGNDAGFKKLAKHPAWLTGAILFYVAGAIHLVALSLGSLAVVQPLIVTELIFIPPIAAIISKIKVPGRDWMWILAVSAALAAFLIVAQPTEGERLSTNLQWVVTLGVLFVAFGVLFAIGRKLAPTPRAAVLGTATGIINAMYVLAAKGVFGGPPIGLFIILAVIAIFSALGGVGFATYAFRSGPVTVSSAAMIVVNPIVATIAAIYLFEVSINDAPWQILLIAIAIIVVVVGIIQLSRSEAVHGEAEDSDPDHPITQPPAPLPD